LRRLVEKTHTPDFNWPAPTLLVVDYAQTLAAPLTDLLRALTHQRTAGLKPLRVLLLERQSGDWFDDLLRAEDSDGPCAVRALFQPPAPVPLTPLPQGHLRRQVLQQTLDKAAQFNGKPRLVLPPAGHADFDASLKRDLFDQPLNLMLAALAAGELGLLPALRRERIELAEVLAEKELRRVERFARDPHNDAQKRALRHLAACATLERGLTAAELDRAVKEELAALQITWPDGPGDLAAVLARALPGKRLVVVPVEPDFVGEALVLLALAKADGGGVDCWRKWCATVERCCRRDSRSAPATLLHAFQNFGPQPKYAEPLLAATDAVIRTGLADTEPELLVGIEGALPHQTVELRLRAAEITRHLYERLKTAMERGRDELKLEVARLANNLAIGLSELGRRAEALAPAQEAVDLHRALAGQNPDAFQPDLASSLNNLATVLSELGRRAEALAPAQEAVDLHRALAQQNPDAFQPDLARSLGAMSQVLAGLERHPEAAAALAEGIRILQPQFEKLPDAFAPLMAALRQDYLQASQAAHIEPDLALLTPVVEILKRRSHGGPVPGP
jgi:tetratricopeptide (TPR) repeat protein